MPGFQNTEPLAHIMSKALVFPFFQLLQMSLSDKPGIPARPRSSNSPSYAGEWKDHKRGQELMDIAGRSMSCQIANLGRQCAGTDFTILESFWGWVCYFIPRVACGVVLVILSAMH